MRRGCWAEGLTRLILCREVVGVQEAERSFVERLIVETAAEVGVGEAN